MACLLVNIVQIDDWYFVVFAHLSDRLVYFIFEFAVEDEVNLYSNVAICHIIKHFRKRRSHCLEIFLRPFRPLVVTYWRWHPRVVGSTENEDDVRIAKVVHASHKRTCCVILMSVART